MPYYYKVPAKTTYRKEYVKDARSGEEREVVTDAVEVIRPEIPSGISYVGKPLDDDWYIVKTDKPVKELEKSEVKQAEEKEREIVKDEARKAEIARIDELRSSFSRGVR